MDVVRENEVMTLLFCNYYNNDTVTFPPFCDQVETRKLWKSWLAKKKTAMPAAKVEDNAELSTRKFFKV